MKDLTLLVDEFMEACNCEATIDETAYHFYELGYKECREQMLKEAVEKTVGQEEGIIAGNLIWHNVVVLTGNELKGAEYGDKVRIIIVKE